MLLIFATSRVHIGRYQMEIVTLFVYKRGCFPRLFEAIFSINQINCTQTSKDNLHRLSKPGLTSTKKQPL